MQPRIPVVYIFDRQIIPAHQTAIFTHPSCSNIISLTGSRLNVQLWNLPVNPVNHSRLIMFRLLLHIISLSLYLSDINRQTIPYTFIYCRLDFQHHILQPFVQQSGITVIHYTFTVELIRPHAHTCINIIRFRVSGHT